MALTPELQYELDRPEYDDKTFDQIYQAIKSQTVPTVGTIRGDDLRNVVAILAGGLQYRLDNAPDSPIRTALLTGFNNMTIQNYGFNLSDPSVAYMLDIATQLGLVTPDERAQFYTLATFNKPVWDGVTMYDIVQHKQPHLIELNDWSGDIPLGNGRTGILSVLSTLPEPIAVVVEIKLSHDGINYGRWMDCTIIPNVHTVQDHIVTFPVYAGMTRKIRWKGTKYLVPGLLKVVG